MSPRKLSEIAPASSGTFATRSTFEDDSAAPAAGAHASTAARTARNPRFTRDRVSSSPVERVNLFSDTQTRPSEAMRAAMANAEVGDEQRHVDPTVNELQERVAHLLGHEGGLFLPSGTMCNLIGFRLHLRAGGDEVILDRTAHPVNFEAGSPAFFSGAMVEKLEGDGGRFTPEQVERAIRPGGDANRYAPRSRLVSVEQTTNIAGGRVWPLDQVQGVLRVAREHGLRAHLDGARLMNAVVASGVPASEWASGFDTAWVDFTKGLGAPVGAVLVGSRELLDEAWRWKQGLGGAMRQAGVLAAACVYALDHHVDRLAEDHENARFLAEGLAELPGVELDPASVESNIVIFGVPDAGDLLGRLAAGRRRDEPDGHDPRAGGHPHGRGPRRRGARARRGEGGTRGVRGWGIGVAIAASAAAFAYLIIGLVTSTLNHDEFGTVPIPGQGVVELDEGTVAVFYQERANLSENESLDVPSFQLDIRRRGDAPVDVEDAGPGSSYELNDLAGTQIGKIEVEETGPYTVRTGGRLGRREPEVSFGEEVPLGTLLLRSALIMVGGALLGGLLWVVGNARRKRTPLRSGWAPHAASAAPAERPPQTGPDPAARLRELDAKRAAGQLSEADYAAARDAILREV